MGHCSSASSSEKKELEERKAIQSKLHNICILCLGWKNAKHDCPVRSCPHCGAMHNALLCNSDKNKNFRCESYLSDEDLTEDPEALIKADKCFLTKRSKSLVEKKSSDKQMEEVKAILKTLSNEQKDRPEKMNITTGWPFYNQAELMIE